MREKWNEMSKFQKGFAVYVSIVLAVIVCLWAAAWNYAAAYEMAQPKGAMNAYMETRLGEQVTTMIADYSEKRANAYQTAEEVSALLTAKLTGQEWSYRKSKEYTSDAPDYILYCGETALGGAALARNVPGLLDFGQAPWEVKLTALDFELLEKNVTIVAPADCKVTLNGAAVKNADAFAEYYPAYAQYAQTIKHPLELQVYHIPICTDRIEIDCGGLRLAEGEEPYTYYAVPQPDEKTVETLEALAPQFAEAYLKYTSNADTYHNVSRFVAPGSELLERLYKSRDGMSWVHYTTGKIVKCEVGEIEYFGNVATYDVEYVLHLKSGEMAGNMHVICVHADYGWRVTDIELF